MPAPLDFEKNIASYKITQYDSERPCDVIDAASRGADNAAEAERATVGARRKGISTRRW
jgi:hypothetical protein